MHNLVSCEYKKMISQREIWIVLILGSVIALAGLAISINDNRREIIQTIASPGQAALLGSYGGLKDFVLCLVPFLASWPCAWYYFEERRGNSISILATRTVIANYYYSKAIVVAITGSCVSMIPFFINLAFCYIAFPSPLNGVFSENVYVSSSLDTIRNTMFPGLYMNYPLLDSIVHILLVGGYGSCMGLLTYSISLFFRKNIITCLSTTTVVGLLSILVFASIKRPDLMIQAFLSVNPSSSNTNVFVFISEILVLLFASVLLITIKIKYQRDILS